MEKHSFGSQFQKFQSIFIGSMIFDLTGCSQVNPTMAGCK